MTILDVARHLGLHQNTARFHLLALVASGQVERVASTRTTPGRPPQVFRAHRGMDPAGPRSYQLLAEALVTRMGGNADATAEAIEAGREWGGRLAPVSADEGVVSNDQATDRLVRILDGLGFSPRRGVSEGEDQIGLAHCPFLDLVPAHAAVVCPIHLGLMRGAMAAMGATVTVDRLEPFVEADLCLAHLGQVEVSA